MCTISGIIECLDEIQPGFQTGPLRFLNLKKCAKIGSKWFWKFENLDSNPDLETSPKKIQSVKTKIRGSLNYKELLQTCHKGAEPFCGMLIRCHSEPFKL
jgi:hypothetical protein